MAETVNTEIKKIKNTVPVKKSSFTTFDSVASDTRSVASRLTKNKAKKIKTEC